MMRRVLKNSQNREKILFLLVVLIVFPGILFATGTITSGWHLVDDHETLRIVQAKVENNISFFDALRKEWINDLTHRWRPVYWFFRVLGAYVFGSSSIIHNLFLCLIGMVTYLLLYQIARNLKSGIFFAHLFALMICVGRQYEIWFRVANQENIGLLFFSLSLWIISKQYKEKSFDKNNFVLLVCVVVCSLVKESFFLALPGIVLLRIGLEGSQRNEKRMKKWLHVLALRWWFWGLAFAVFLWSAYMILFQVGTAPIDYAGVDVEEGWKQVIWNIMRMRKESLSEYVWITVSLGIILIATVLYQMFCKRKFPEDSIAVFLFGGYIIVVEMILYAKSGMWDRYLVPFVVGYGLIFGVLAERLVKNRLIRGIYVIFFICFLGVCAYSALFREAIPYGEEGRQLRAVLQYVERETTENDDILVLLDAHETNIAMCNYLEYKGRPNVFIYVEEGTEEEWPEKYNSILQRSEDAAWKVMISTPEVGNTVLKKMSGQVSEEWTEVRFGNCFLTWVRK